MRCTDENRAVDLLERAEVNMNIRNFRDIRGYKNQDGNVMKKNRIFRGGALDRLTQEQAEYFENELGIKHILDFRDEKEAKMAEDYTFKIACYEQIGALRVQNHDKDGFDFSTNHEGLSQPIMKIGEGWLHYCFSFLF